MMQETSSSIGLHYLSSEQLVSFVKQFHSHILGVVGYGSKNEITQKMGVPAVWVDMPVLNSHSMYEVWTSSEPVTHSNDNGIASTQNEAILYGSFAVHQLPGEDLESATFRAYSSVFDFIDRQGYPHLLRIWHYFPKINAPESGLERYRGFNVGRHEAFTAKGRLIANMTVPAACALGTGSGPLVVYFIAGKQPGKPLENPRQTSAYHYPEQFGPRSPTFSRAILVGTGKDQTLFISGTASIVGHETLHDNDVVNQTRETLVNIQTLFEQAKQAGFDALDHDHQLFLKVYLKNPEDLPLVRDQITKAVGDKSHIIFFQADVCRSDLLIEIEGMVTHSQPVKH
ncbi:chorismate transformation enzyme, FkbO/Hyg5 family [Sulfurirhabdus autotrophica]|uniref:Enamine deaminase RidA (YjgF/YER057c/UK114 family) n=1 Tax=Sulfurirhabdus autotrophica TaxID=1706046 RepID=A0A4R3Y9W9_9PROT|nr:hypothetical protein [Sulfurirhabdus autotrophica]TCV87454.1 enamine deaminase RidA (YjgF/YER057c/UK114 family) [Sulfurirhabdus autotrophica]